MNGYAHGPAADDYAMPPKSTIDPNGRVVVDSYRDDIVNGFEKQPSLHNPMNPERTQSSQHVDLKDPIQVHLLTETALADSKEYEILSQEEIDGLKKQSQLLTQRIESTRSNLLIQSKYRDAAVSMAKLYAPSGSDGSQESDEEAIREAEIERETCERKCEELAAELFHLEKRLMEPKRRLLEHTAGILQLTHKASRKKAIGPNGNPLNEVPGSPESMYTYTQSRNSLDGPDDFYTDDTSFNGFDMLDTRGPRKNPIEIPLKSPIREQQSQLMDTVTEMERKLETLNQVLRETIVRFNPQENGDFEGPPIAVGSSLKAGDILKSQIDYLESGLMAVQAEQEGLLAASRAAPQGGESDRELLMLWDLIQNGYTGIKQEKDDRRKARAEKGLEDDESDDDGIDLSEEYSLFNFSSRVRWLYRQATILKDQKSVLKRQIKQQRELNNKSDAEKDAEIADKQEALDRSEREAMQAQKMLSEALEDLEKARENGGDEVQAELAERTHRTRVLESKLQDLQEELRETETNSQETQNRLAQLDAAITTLSSQLDEVSQSRDEAEQRAQELQASSDELQSRLAAKEKELEGLHGSSHEMQAIFATKEKELEGLHGSSRDLQATLTAKEEELEGLHGSSQKLQAMLTNKEKELEDLNVLYAELKTEVTIARAELDGAYGSRAERAADAAAVLSSSEVEKLRTELADTAKELEEVTKETIASERERVDLESKLDDALAARSELEAELGIVRQRLEGDLEQARDHVHKLQDQLDGEKLRAGRGSGDGVRPGAGASMLSEQFRTTMREERKKYQEDIKEERSRSRKLEEELARLKRAQGPGKSPLSPSPR